MTYSDALNLTYLYRFHPRTVLPNAFACNATPIQPDVGSIGDCFREASALLAERLRFTGRLHLVNDVDETGETRTIPNREDFADDDSWDEAVQHWEWSTKPWCRVKRNGHTELAQYLVSRLTWTSNSRKYNYYSPGFFLGLFRSGKYDPPKHEQDELHDRTILAFANTVADIVGENATVYDSNHLLDLDSVDRTEFDWDCFSDEMLACVGTSALVMIWIGHSRASG